MDLYLGWTIQVESLGWQEYSFLAKQGGYTFVSPEVFSSEAAANAAGAEWVRLNLACASVSAVLDDLHLKGRLSSREYRSLREEFCLRLGY